MKNKHFIFAAAILSMAFASCKKDPGFGGNITLVALPQHNGAPVMGSTAYMKFGMTSYADTLGTAWDATLVGDDAENHVHIEELQPGDYFIWMMKYDSATSDTLMGGMGITLTKSDRNKEVDLVIPIR